VEQGGPNCNRPAKTKTPKTLLKKLPGVVYPSFVNMAGTASRGQSDLVKPVFDRMNRICRMEKVRIGKVLILFIPLILSKKVSPVRSVALSPSKSNLANHISLRLWAFAFKRSAAEERFWD
jgi:hypothetical protein